ncbi:Dnmt3b, partial [Symbiodinium pilosum]
MAKAKVEALRRMLQEARLPEEFANHCITTLKMESIEDYVNIVTVKDYETELKVVLTDQCAATKDSALMLARARSAWRAGRTIVLRNEHKRQQGEPVEDMDCALEQSTQESLMAQFEATYQISLDIHWMPADTLLGRVFRECQRLMPTVIPATKIRSLYWAAKPRNEKAVVLSDQVKLQLDKDEQMPVKSVLEYYRCLRILGHAYAIVGQHKSTDVVFAPLSINLKYPDTVLRIASSSSLGPSDLLNFVRQKDESTRARLVELVRQGYPQGEALNKAWAEFELHWITAPSKRPAEEANATSPEKRPRTGREVNGMELCKKWNDNRGCDGTCGKLDACDVMLSDGRICASKKHNRMTCPHR